MGGVGGWRRGLCRRLSALPARDEEEYWWGREKEDVTLYDEGERESVWLGRQSARHRAFAQRRGLGWVRMVT